MQSWEKGESPQSPYFGRSNSASECPARQRIPHVGTLRLRERPWSAIRNVAAPPDAALVRSLVELALEDSFDEQLDGRPVEYARGKVAELDGEDVAGIAIETAIAVIAVDATNADRRGPGKARKVIRRVQADHATIEAMTGRGDGDRCRHGGRTDVSRSRVDRGRAPSAVTVAISRLHVYVESHTATSRRQEDRQRAGLLEAPDRPHRRWPVARRSPPTAFSAADHRIRRGVAVTACRAGSPPPCGCMFG